jgi:osmotically-inducible protein OsmY
LSSPGELAYIAEHIREHLAVDERVGALGLEVTVIAGRVFVRGCVASQQCQSSVSTVVSEIAGDLAIANETVVCGDSPPVGEPEVLS